MSEVRLIDANALRKHILALTGMFTDEMGFAVSINSVKVAIQLEPTIDAVPVVRCQECLKRQTVNCPMFLRGGDYAFHNGFCHLGAKMDGDPKAKG